MTKSKNKLSRNIITHILLWANEYKKQNPNSWTKYDTNVYNALIQIRKKINHNIYIKRKFKLNPKTKPIKIKIKIKKTKTKK